MAFPILGNPSPAFFDSSGSPLADGTLAVLDPADDTNKASYPTYDDAEAATNANANPITLDARGSCNLWGLDNEDYKLVLLDSAGATVNTDDDIFLPNRHKITAGETAGGITPVNYHYPPGNVLRYGTNTTPGTTDMTTAIQNAIDGASNGGFVYLPAGEYLCSGVTIIRPLRFFGDSNTAVSSAGGATYAHGSVLKAATGGNNYVIQVQVSSVKNWEQQLYGVTIENLGITGNDRTLDMGGISLKQIDHCIFRNLEIMQFQREAINCINEVRECDFIDVGTRWCGTKVIGGTSYPSINLTETSTVDSHNNLRFTNCQIVFSLGDFVLYEDNASAANAVRAIYWINCFSHGILASQDGGLYTFTADQKETIHHDIRGAQDVFFVNTDLHQSGLAEPCIKMSDSANSVSPRVYFSSGRMDSHYGATQGTITGITLDGSNVVSIAMTAHGLRTGNTAKFASVGGTTELNGNVYVITSTGTNSFTLDGTDSSNFSAWTSGGAIIASRNGAHVKTGELSLSNSFLQNQVEGAIRVESGATAHWGFGNTFGVGTVGPSYASGSTTDDNLYTDIDFNDHAISNASIIALSESVAAFPNTLTAAESGKTIYLNLAGGGSTILPAVAAGLNFTFIVSTIPTTAYTIDTPSGANIMSGTISDIVGETVYGTAQDIISFIASTSVLGDRVDLSCDGTIWAYRAVSGANGGITSGQT